MVLTPEDTYLCYSFEHNAPLPRRRFERAVTIYPKESEKKINTLNVSYELPIVDSHCHIFGQALFEGGDLITFVDDAKEVTEWSIYNWLAGVASFLGYDILKDLVPHLGLGSTTAKTDAQNAARVLGDVPQIAWQNAHSQFSCKEFEKLDYSRACVPLLLDMGYTPLELPLPNWITPNGPEITNSLILGTEKKEVATSESATPSFPGKLVLRLEILQCVSLPDIIDDHDDEVTIVVKQGGDEKKYIGPLTVDDENTTRMLNEQIPIDKGKSIKITLSGTEFVDVDDGEPKFKELVKFGTEEVGSSETATPQAVEFSLSHYAGNPSQYRVTYTIEKDESDDEGDDSDSQYEGYVLVLEKLKCIEKEDWTEDEVRIDIEDKQFGAYDFNEGETKGINKNVKLPYPTTIKLTELDWPDEHDDLGSFYTPFEEVDHATHEFTDDGAHYVLTYSIVKGDPAPDQDTYYTPDTTYLWFRRDSKIFEGTIRELHRAAMEYPGEVLPLVPFDPRRPDGLKFVKEAVNKLGFVGVKTYSRCGWMPYNNAEIHGSTEWDDGSNLDQRLDELYTFLKSEDLPILNHTSPGGWPPVGLTALPKYYYPHGDMPDDFRGPTGSEAADPPFPPIWTKKKYVADGGKGSKEAREAVARTCIAIASYAHYVQKTTSPYAWDPVLDKYPDLRLCLAHSGSDCGVLFEHALKDEASPNDIRKWLLDPFHSSNASNGRLYDSIKNDPDLVKKFRDSTLVREDVKLNGFVDRGKNYRTRFVEAVIDQMLGFWAWLGGTVEDGVIDGGFGFEGALPAAMAGIKPVANALGSNYLPRTWFNKRWFRKLPVELTEDAIEEFNEAVAAPFRSLWRDQIEDFIEFNFGSGMGGKVWENWFEKWESAYELTWYGKILELEKQKTNVHSDIAYLSGEKTDVFCELVRMIVNDAFEEGENKNELRQKHMVGTDWFMIEGSGMSAGHFWDRVRKVVVGKGDGYEEELSQKDNLKYEKLWRAWSSENSLRWLNLDGKNKDRIDKLLDLYKKKGGGEMGRKPPPWWAFRLKEFYKS